MNARQKRTNRILDIQRYAMFIGLGLILGHNALLMAASWIGNQSAVEVFTVASGFTCGISYLMNK